LQAKTNEEIISLDKKSEYKIEGVIYKVTPYFDENAEELNHKIKRLLKNEINSGFESVI